jgi:DNA (cytosine-5)-methyltransferase 1
MRVGSLFSGYGGLDLAVGGEVAWYSEIEPAACKVLAAHHPGVPNLGDIKKVDWSTVEPVDVITGGYPCQPFSAAGHRKGKEDERHLWPYVKDAISALRPRLAILENVRGHLSLGLADVIRELAAVGYDARWGLVRASDAGAPHGRARVFIVAYPESDLSDERPARHNVGAIQEAQSYQGSLRGVDSTSWGKYGPAISRWGRTVGRPAPDAIYERAGRARLNPVFVEWMMGLPKGHVTGHGLSAAQELKMLGNGVCPQQARLALELLGFPS